MSIDFRLEPLAREIFEHFFPLSDEELRERSGRWLVADSQPGHPCRVSLEDAAVGERVLALPYTHLDVQSPYRASGPVFVRETAQTATPGVNEIPIMFFQRLLSLRAYDSEGMMIHAKVVEGTGLAKAIVDHFDDANVAYQHIHNANPGCFNCAVQRV